MNKTDLNFELKGEDYMLFRVYSKKTLSLLLSISFLISCFVFSAPETSALNSWYDCGTSSVGVSSTAPYVGLSTGSISNNKTGKYRVRLCILEMDGFDASVHDRPGGITGKDYPYEPGYSFGYSNNQRNINGMSTGEDLGTNEVERDSSLTQHKFWCEWAQIRYKINNGTGTGVLNSNGVDSGLGSVWFNIGDQDAGGRKDIISSGEYNYGYFPSDDGVLIDGFPTGFSTRYVEKGNGTGQYGVYLQVAVWDDSEKGYHWEEGTCTGTPGVWGALGGGWSNDYAGGLIYAQTEKVSTVSSGTELKISADLNENNSEDLAKFPYACKSGTTAYKSTDSKIPVYFASSQTSTSSISEFSCPSKTGSSSCYVNFTSPVDQYGATMTAKVLLQTTKEDKVSYLSQSAKRTYVYYGANISGDEDSQLLRATVTWQQKVNTSSCKQCESTTNELTVYDAQYPVEWYSFNNTLIQTQYYYFGDTPSNEVPYRSFDDVHYVNLRWNHDYEQVSDKSDNSYIAVYDTAEHNYTSYTSLNNYYHKAECTADPNDIHYVTFEHRITEEVVAPKCNAQGYTRHYCLDCEYYYDTDFVKKLSHSWDDGIVTTEPTCTTHGVKTYTCTICGETDERIISALDHIITLKTFYDENGVPAGVYFSCDRNCGAGYWQAAYNEETGKYYVANKTPFASPEEAVSGTEAAVSKLEFNSFEDANTGHNYENRDASLRYDNMTVPVTQAMRFMASVKVPGGVSWAMGSENNAIEDVGFVYSLTSIVGDDKEALKLGKDNVYSISVANRNESAGVYDGSNWNGVSKHETAGGTFLTFNIVINVSYSNWSKPFSARAYTKYNYNGFEYLVYDNDYSSRSVEYIANQVVNNPEESQAARDYCQKVIINNIV